MSQQVSRPLYQAPYVPRYQQPASSHTYQYTQPRVNVMQTLISYLEQEAKRNDISFTSNETSIAFESCIPPTITAQNYIWHILKQSYSSESVVLYSLIYLHRVSKKQVAVTSLSLHRLFLVALMLATKFVEDQACLNLFWAQCGGITIKEFNFLEAYMLKLLDWNLCVSDAEIESFLDLLTQRSAYLQSSSRDLHQAYAVSEASPVRHPHLRSSPPSYQESQRLHYASQYQQQQQPVVYQAPVHYPQQNQAPLYPPQPPPPPQHSSSGPTTQPQPQFRNAPGPYYSAQLTVPPSCPPSTHPHGCTYAAPAWSGRSQPQQQPQWKPCYPQQANPRQPAYQPQYQPQAQRPVQPPQPARPPFYKAMPLSRSAS